jgi:hypothetical protein
VTCAGLVLRDEQDRRELCSVALPGAGQCTFADHAFVRVEEQGVNAWGDIRGLRLTMPVSKPTFSHNGRTPPFSAQGGELVYESKHQ